LEEINVLRKEISLYHETLAEVGGFKNLKLLLDKRELEIKHLKSNIKYLTSVIRSKG